MSLVYRRQRSVDPRLADLASLFTKGVCFGCALGDFAGQGTVQNQIGLPVVGNLQGGARIGPRGVTLDGTSGFIEFPHNFGMDYSTYDAAIVVGATLPPASSWKGTWVKVGTSGGVGIGVGNGTDGDHVGTKFMGVMEAVMWANFSPPDMTAGFHTLAMLCRSSSILGYIDGQYTTGKSGTAIAPQLRTQIGGGRTIPGEIHFVMFGHMVKGSSDINSVVAAANQIFPAGNWQERG